MNIEDKIPDSNISQSNPVQFGIVNEISDQIINGCLKKQTLTPPIPVSHASYKYFTEGAKINKERMYAQLLDTQNIRIMANYDKKQESKADSIKRHNKILQTVLFEPRNNSLFSA